jgi:hypothetical protein
MTDPDPKEYKWLIARERGEDISHVLPAERAPYEELGALIGSGMRPGAGWRQRVLDAIDAAEPPRASEPELAAAPAPVAAPEAAPVAAPEAAPVAAPEAAPVAAPETVVVAEPAPVVAGEPAPAPAARQVPDARPSPAPELAPAPVMPIAEARRRRWPKIAGGIAAVAAAAAAIVIIPKLRSHPSEPSPMIALATEVRHGPTVLRADPERPDQAGVGDTLLVRAEATGPAEVRVYGGSSEHLIASCNDRGGSGCTVERDGERRRFVLEVPLEVPGMVRAVIFVGAGLPPSTGSLEPDLEAAASARIKFETRTPTRVL